VPLRLATNSDCPEIKRLVFEVLAEFGLKPDESSLDRDIDDIQHHYFNRNGCFYVVEQEQTIIATLGLYQLDEQRCELRKMYILPEHRAAGLGKQLLELAISEAKQRGYSRMELETASPLKAAVALYQGYGFSEFKPKHLASRCDRAFYLELAS
jgi:putative acetyltransferase